MFTTNFNRRLTLILAGLGLAFATASPAATAPAVPLAEEVHINETLIAAAVGALIKDNCESMEPRVLSVMQKAWALKRYALDQGYTEDEIEAFLKSRKEKRRVRTAADAYLAANGVVEGTEETYCLLGRKEIASGTLTGELLVER